MAVETENRLDDAISLIREGRIQEADNLISALKDALAAEAGRAAVTPAPAPRSPQEILLAFGRELVAHLGSPARLAALLAEYEKSSAGAGATAKPQE